MTVNHLSPDFNDVPGRRTIQRNYKRDTDPFAKQKIDVSIVTPYFNTEAFFVETFISLLAQSLQNWEWVIVDDGSLDRDAITRLAEVAAKDLRVRTIRQENAGPSAARNTGYKASIGRYICLLDSDDLLEPTYLEKCVWFLDSNENFAFCNSRSIIFGEQEFLYASGFERGKAHLQANVGPINSVIRRAAYSDCGGFVETIKIGHEDWDFWLAMAKAGHWGYTIPEYMQWIRKRANGRFEQTMKTGRINDEFEKLMHKKYEGLEKKFPEPVRLRQTPYESIETHALVTNSLAKNPTGRRIMFIVPWMVTGGADRVNLDLIEGLTAKGHDVTVCATLSADHQWEFEFSRFTPDIFVLPNFLKISDYPRFLSYIIKSRHIDTIVITGSTLGYQFLPYLRTVSPEVAFVDMCHVEEPHWLNGGHPRFGVGYQDMLDLNITTTGNLAEWMHGQGSDRARIKVLYTGVRTSKSTTDDRLRMRSELGIPADMPVIVFAGRICEQKRPAMLANILKNAHEQGMVFIALIVGDGELRQQFEKLLSEYQLVDRVQMLGSVTHQRWLETLAASDILLMPSKYEGISIALLEAIATGVVPIVAKVGGQDEIVSADAGVLVPHTDDELREYVDAIGRLLSDPLTLKKMSTQCKYMATSKLSWNGMIDNFSLILDEAHQLRVNTPRNRITPQFGRELVTQALECNRLSESVEWLWHSKTKNTTTDSQLLTATLETQAAARLAIVLSQTWLGRKLIRNKFLQAIGKRVLIRFGKPV